MITNILKLFILVLASFVFLNCSGPKEESFKLMTWNIWHGGLHGSKSSNFEKDTVNTLNILKVLEHEQADILFMQETYCCGMDIAKKAGYPYSVRGSSNLSIHSKYPIVDTIGIYKPFNAHAAIINVKGQHFLCVNLWLHYLPDYFQDIKTRTPDSLIKGEGLTRLKEIKAILNVVDSLDKILDLPILIGGDFNSGSHLDWIESTKPFHFGKVVEWPVSKYLMDQHFNDSFRDIHPDPNKTLDGTWGFLYDDIISDRIDFIYYRGRGVQAIESKIVMDDPKGGFFNSDHRAIISQFVLTP